MSPAALRSAATRLQNRMPKSSATRGGVPLSALRARLDEASASARWLLHADGVLGRALFMPDGAAIGFPLELSGDVAFSARAMLLPHDWRDGRGAVHARVSVSGPSRRSRELWSGKLRAADLGRPRGRLVDCRIPAWSTSLQLSVVVRDVLTPLAVARAIWLDPIIMDPYAPIVGNSPVGAFRLPVPYAEEPLISVLTPVHDPPLRMLEEAITSVRQQTFTDWELCLVDDGSTKPDVIAALERHAASDHRIRLKRRDTAGGISTATNAAMELATGRYIALLDHDDTLAPDALQHVAEQIADNPKLDMIYTDEDVIGDGGLIERHPKPDWSPEHMAALMYTCHLGVYRRTLAVELGGFQSTFDGCQDYDFVLRLMERTDRIAHIPRILYHWRAHAGSTAGGDAKPYAYLAQPRAIAAHLKRSRVDAEVQFGRALGLHRIVHRVDPSTSVDLVLAVEDEDGLDQAGASWLLQPHSNWNIILAAPADTLDAASTALTTAGIPRSRITAIQASPDDNPAVALATAAAAATAEHLVLMQTAVVGLTHDWLTRLIGYSSQPHIAAAGPVVLAPDGRIQEAGIALPEGIPLHLHHGSDATAAPPVVYNVSAVSGVLATRRSTYQQLRGLNPGFQELSLIEYCLRATERDERIVLVPDARLRTTGPDQTTNDLPTIWRLRQSWAKNHTHDPYYNPNYRTDRGDFIFADSD